MKIQHYHFHHNESQEGRLRSIGQKLDLILRNQEAIMASLEDVLKDVTDESSQLDSLSTLISGLQQQVTDALANTGISAADQAKVDAIFIHAETNKAKIATALGANTPDPGSVQQ